MRFSDKKIVDEIFKTILMKIELNFSCFIGFSQMNRVELSKRNLLRVVNKSRVLQ